MKRKHLTLSIILFFTACLQVCAHPLNDSFDPAGTAYAWFQAWWEENGHNYIPTGDDFNYYWSQLCSFRDTYAPLLLKIISSQSKPIDTNQKHEEQEIGKKNDPINPYKKKEPFRDEGEGEGEYTFC